MSGAKLNLAALIDVANAKGGNIAAAARQLGIPRSTLWDRLQHAGYFGNKVVASKSHPSSSTVTDEDIRNARIEDAKLDRVRDELSIERKKRKQAEADLDEAVERLQFYTTAGDITLPAPPTGILRQDVLKGKRDKATAVVSCCDWHIGETVPSDEVNGLNEYSLDIAAARCDQLWEKAAMMIEHERQMADISEVVLWLGGDMISGEIHEDLAESNEAGILACLKFAQERISEGLSLLSHIKGIEQVVVPCSRGNHARTTDRSRHHGSDQHSYEGILYNTLAVAHKTQEKVVFYVVPSPFLLLPVQGHVCRFTHGDLIRYQGGVLGVGVPTLKAIAKWNANQHADMTFLGHYHQAEWHRQYIMSGSLVGFDQYSQSIGAKCEPPSQQFTIVSSKRGVTKSYPLFVED